MKNIFISFLIIFLGVQSSCGQSKSAAPAPSNTVGVQWETTSLQDAKQKAVSLDKPLLVEFYSPDCSHCAEMNTFMSTKPAGDFINPKYVPYKVNLSSPEGEEIAKKYRVKDYPKFYVFDKSGAIKDIFSAGHDTASFKYFYDRQKNNTNTFAHLKSRLAAGERIDTNTLKEFIRNLWTTQDPMAAKAIDLWVDSKKPEELMIGTSWDISRKNLDGIQNKLATYMLQNRQAYYQKYGEKDVKSLLQYFASSEIIMGLNRGEDRKPQAIAFLQQAGLSEAEMNSAMSWALVLYYDEQKNPEKLAENYADYFKYKTPVAGMYSYAILKLCKLNPTGPTIAIAEDWLNKSKELYGAEAETNGSYLYTKAYVLYLKKDYANANSIINSVITANRNEGKKTGEQVELQKKIAAAMAGK